MATKAAHKRLTKEAQMMAKDPPPLCFARPKEDNILEWHFILRGAPDTPYEGGEYWGQLIFPGDYPFKPPGIKMSTPSGRFKPDTKICTSMSDFHPGTWNPAWSVSNILIGLLSFMSSEEMTTGSVSSSAQDRKIFSQRSHEWNIKQKKFVTLFPEYSQSACVDLPNMGKPGQVGGGDVKNSKASKLDSTSAQPTPSTSSSSSSTSTSTLTNSSNPISKVRSDSLLPKGGQHSLDGKFDRNLTLDSSTLSNSNPNPNPNPYPNPTTTSTFPSTSTPTSTSNPNSVKQKREVEKGWKSSTTLLALVGAALACLYAKGAGWI